MHIMTSYYEDDNTASASMSSYGGMKEVSPGSYFYEGRYYSEETLQELVDASMEAKQEFSSHSEYEKFIKDTYGETELNRYVQQVYGDDQGEF